MYLLSDKKIKINNFKHLAISGNPQIAPSGQSLPFTLKTLIENIVCFECLSGFSPMGSSFKSFIKI